VLFLVPNPLSPPTFHPRPTRPPPPPADRKALLHPQIGVAHEWALEDPRAPRVQAQDEGASAFPKSPRNHPQNAPLPLRPTPLPPTRRSAPALSSGMSMGSRQSVKRVLIPFVPYMGALCVGFAGSLPLGSCRSSPSPPSSPCVLNPPPRPQKDPPSSSTCVGVKLSKAASSQVAASSSDDPVFPSTPSRFFCPTVTPHCTVRNSLVCRSTTRRS
jgi:hypothetical protein